MNKNNPESKNRNQQQTQPIYGVSLGSLTRWHCCEVCNCWHHYIIPPAENIASLFRIAFFRLYRHSCQWRKKIFKKEKASHCLYKPCQSSWEKFAYTANASFLSWQTARPQILSLNLLPAVESWVRKRAKESKCCLKSKRLHEEWELLCSVMWRMEKRGRGLNSFNRKRRQLQQSGQQKQCNHFEM